MKALILAGGTGSRLRPITHSIAKQLIPVANKPVIEFGIEAILETGISDFGIIVGDARSEIESHLGDGSKWGASFTYIPQSAPLGLAHAVKTARPYLRDEKFIMYLGDNLIKGGVKELVDDFRKGQCDASILLTKAPNPEQFGVAELQGDRVVRLEEKPKNPKSDLALVGVYLFTPIVFDAIETLQPSFRGEYEITDAIQTLINWNKRVRYEIVTGWWKDTGTVQAMLEANRLILQTMSHKQSGTITNSRIQGEVSIGTGSHLINSVVIGPAIIGQNCKIENCTIGPFAAVGSECRITGIEASDSIVMNGCELRGHGLHLTSSLLGRNVSLQAEGAPKRTMNLVLGDNSSLTVS